MRERVCLSMIFYIYKMRGVLAPPSIEDFVGFGIFIRGVGLAFLGRRIYLLAI